MQLSYGIVYDLIFLAILVFAMAVGRKKGLLAGLFGMVGLVVGLAGALFVAQQGGEWFYQKVLGGAIARQVELAVQNAGGDLTAAVAQLGFLPASLRLQLGGLLGQTAGSLPGQVVALLQPLLLPLIQVVIFVVVWLAVRLVFHLVGKLLQGVNQVPLVGGLNRALGLAMGLVTGALDCWLLSLLLWLGATISQGQWAFLGQGALGQSLAYNFLRHFNPFLTYY